MDDIELLRALVEGWNENAEACNKSARRFLHFPSICAAKVSEAQIYTECARVLREALDEIARQKEQVAHG